MLRARLLGALEVELNGTVIESPATQRPWALFAYLALAGRPVSRAELATTFWPDVLDLSARASLRSALWSLRRQIGDAIAVEGDRVELRNLEWVDVRDDGSFELSRRELLEELDDEWAIQARERHRQRVLELLEERARTAEPARARRLPVAGHATARRAVARGGACAEIGSAAAARSAAARRSRARARRAHSSVAICRRGPWFCGARPRRGWDRQDTPRDRAATACRTCGHADCDLRGCAEWAHWRMRSALSIESARSPSSSIMPSCSRRLITMPAWSRSRAIVWSRPPSCLPARLSTARATVLEPLKPSDFPDSLVPRLARVQGLIALARGDRNDARRRFEEAIAGWQRLVARAGKAETIASVLADLGRPVVGLVEPERELARVRAELETIDETEHDAIVH